MSKARVLVVDDAEDVCQWIALVLKSAGYEVHTFTDGTLARQAVVEQEYDVVVTDLQMPDVSGEEIVQVVNNLHPFTRCIVLTGHGDVETAVRMMVQGAFDFRTKPLHPEGLVQAVERAVADRKRHLENGLYRSALAILANDNRERLPRTLVRTAAKVCRADYACVLNEEGEILNGVRRGGYELATDLKRVIARQASNNTVTVVAQLDGENASEKALIVPLPTEGQLMQLIIARRPEAQMFSRTDIEHVTVLASQIALAWTNTALNDEVQQSSEMLGRVQNVFGKNEWAASLGDHAVRTVQRLTAPIKWVQSNLEDLDEAMDDPEDARARLKRVREGIDAIEQELTKLGRLARRQRHGEFWVADWVHMALEVSGFDDDRRVVTALEDVAVVGLQTELVPALHAVLENAGEAISKIEDGEIHINASRLTQGDHIQIEVEDNGPQPEVEVLKRALEPFFTTKPGAAGMGLTRCAEIVKRAGGAIELDRSDLGGTLVRMLLPAAQSEDSELMVD